MVSPFSVSYHDAMDENAVISLDCLTLADRGRLILRIGELSVITNADRLRQLREVIGEALVPPQPVVAILDAAVDLDGVTAL